MTRRKSGPGRVCVRDRLLSALRVILQIGEIALQDQRRGHGIHHLLPLFGVLAAVEEDLVGVNGGAALVPQHHRQAGGFLQQLDRKSVV